MAPLICGQREAANEAPVARSRTPVTPDLISQSLNQASDDKQGEPVAALSASRRTSNIDVIRRSHGNECLTKEFNQDELAVLHASSVFPKLHCFGGVNSAAVLALAKVAKRRYFPANIQSTTGIILAENTSDNDFLWVIEKGSVEVQENGHSLGSLSLGAMFGDLVVLGHLDRQPFTVRLALHVPLVAWCVPHAAVSSALRQRPDVRRSLEEFAAQQVRQLFLPRINRMTLFMHCSRLFLQPIQRQMKLEYHKRDAVLVASNDLADSMIVVVRGTCKLTPQHGRHASGQSTCMDPDGSMDEDRSRSVSSFIPPRVPLQKDSALESAGNEEAANGTSEDGTASLCSSLRSASSLLEIVPFELPESRACLEPTEGSVRATAGPGVVAFGDAALLGFQETRPCTATAVSDCLAFVFRKHGFVASLKWHALDARRFALLAEAQYQEWHHCGLARLSTVHIFSGCSSAFLSALAAVARPRLFFPRDIIIEEGSCPKGLVLLMSGIAEQKLQDDSVKTVMAPHSFGPLQFLGAKLPVDPLRALDLCQVLLLSRHDILECLKHHPDESTVMVLQTFQHNGKRLSLLGQKEEGCPRRREDLPKEQVLQLNLWQLPFCKGLDPAFTVELTTQLEVVKLVPGQSMFKTGDDAEVLTVLTKGRICIRGTCEEDRKLGVPFIVCGRNRDTRVEAVAIELCDVHRLSTAACDRLVESFREDTRCFFERVSAFQARLENKLNYPWWSQCAVLRHQAVFAESQHAFLRCVAESMSLRIYMPGDVLVQEGTQVDSTIMIERGEATVQRMDPRACAVVTNPVTEVKDGFCIGGIGGICGFAGELIRNSTIRAITLCKVHQLMNSVFVDILSSFPEERQRFRHLAERQLQFQGESEHLEEQSFFKGFSRDLLNLLRPKCRPRVFFADEALMRQGEPAESLVILDAHASVTIEADGGRREHRGRACLGVKALLSKWPVRRASTVVTRVACAVRTLTRVDWLEALKHHPEHRRWIDAFTVEQLELVGKARVELHRRRAWDKIRSREACASQVHNERISCRGPPSRCDGKRAGGTPRPQRPGPGDDATPRSCRTFQEEDQLERWDCFNGKQVTVPHTRLPQLLVAACKGEPKAEIEGGASDAKRASIPHTAKDRRPSDLWQAYENSLGLED